MDVGFETHIGPHLSTKEERESVEWIEWVERKSGAGAGPPVPPGRRAAAVPAAPGGVLGRYDGEGQREALALTRVQLSQCLERAAEDRSRLGRVYGALGLTAGAFLVILLL